MNPTPTPEKDLILTCGNCDERAASGGLARESLRARLYALFKHHDVPPQMTGICSLMSLHAICGPIRNADDVATSDDRKKELVFLDPLERGIYIARRVFRALSTWSAMRYRSIRD